MALNITLLHLLVLLNHVFLLFLLKVSSISLYSFFLLLFLSSFSFVSFLSIINLHSLLSSILGIVKDCAQLGGMFWIGGGLVDVKLGLNVTEFIEKYHPFITDVYK